jgi:hypothetical protein
LTALALGKAKDMEIGAFFILVVLVLVVLALGGGVLAIATRLRGRQLDPRADKAEHPRQQAEPHDRPQHLEVENEEQRTRFVGSR